MIGLAYLLAFGLYILISVVVVLCAIGHARKYGKSAKRWGWGAALVMYLIPFWDWIPTVVMHQYYCATQAGFWVYKTVDQWKAENPGVMEMLVMNKGAPSIRQGDMVNYTDTYFLNQRINWLIKKTGPFLFNRWRWEESVVDSNTNEVLIRFVDFSTGNGHIGGEPELRFWLHSNGCVGGNAANHAQVYEYRKQLSGRTK